MCSSSTIQFCFSFILKRKSSIIDPNRESTFLLDSSFVCPPSRKTMFYSMIKWRVGWLVRERGYGGGNGLDEYI
jgi:hypothetical protein